LLALANVAKSAIGQANSGAGWISQQAARLDIENRRSEKNKIWLLFNAITAI
jgi:hypothetical protein